MTWLLEFIFGPAVPENPSYEIIQDIASLVPWWYLHFVAGCMALFLIFLWAGHRRKKARMIPATAMRSKHRGTRPHANHSFRVSGYMLSTIVAGSTLPPSRLDGNPIGKTGDLKDSIMFQRKKQPVYDQIEMTQPSPAPTGVNPAMVAQLDKAARYAEEAQNDVEAQSKPEKRNQTLIVGPGIRLKGEITNCDTFVVEGHVEGSAKACVVEIAKCGTFIGDIEIKTADIRGHFDGSLNASERLVIRPTGRVSGQIRYKSIEIEAGGRISGDVQDEEEAKGASLLIDRSLNSRNSEVESVISD